MENPVLDCLLNHRSIRRFTADPIDRETLGVITHAGTRAATAGNLQGYSLVVVDDQKTLEDWLPLKAAAAVIALVDTYRMKRWFELCDAPFHFDKPSSFLISFWDAIIALHNTVIAAESIGLGAVYIGGVISEDMGETIGAPEYTFPAGLVLLGHPDQNPPLRPRLPDEAVVHYDRYHVPTDDEVRAWYADIDRTFDEKSDEKRAALRAKGIHNRAQQITLGRYNEAIHSEMSTGIVDNLRKAGFTGFSG
ncbi:nitroreductase family protein [Candidatus Bipolaricaulota bacterium]|nr:nitroreductase family protein [Candidatus Bipolaricaulota bacterium]